jgi:hypothetical protein
MHLAKPAFNMLCTSYELHGGDLLVRLLPRTLDCHTSAPVKFVTDAPQTSRGGK